MKITKRDLGFALSGSAFALAATLAFQSPSTNTPEAPTGYIATAQARLTELAKEPEANAAAIRALRKEMGDYTDKKTALLVLDPEGSEYQLTQIALASRDLYSPALRIVSADETRQAQGQTKQMVGQLKSMQKPAP